MANTNETVGLLLLPPLSDDDIRYPTGQAKPSHTIRTPHVITNHKKNMSANLITFGWLLACFYNTIKDVKERNKEGKKEERERREEKEWDEGIMLKRYCYIIKPPH